MFGAALSVTSPVAHRENADPRAMLPITLEHSSIEIDVMIYGQQRTEHRPLVILNSIELPMPPSQAFCERMWHAGYQVFFVRRPGFGGAPGLPAALLTPAEVQNGAAAITEAALHKRLIETLGLTNVVLLGLGTSNPVSMRLSKLSPDVRLTILANPLFHHEVWDIVRPRWMQSMVRQTLISRSGLKITVKGLKSALRRNPQWFYRQFAQKSAGDIAYVSENADDFFNASRLMQNISPETVYYDLQMAMVQDTNVDEAYFRDVTAVILCGEETTETWKTQIAGEAERFSIPLVFAPSGDLFVPYRSPDTLLGLLSEHLQGVARS